MHLYFHHVGESGARRDFPKTVWSAVSTDWVAQHIPEDEPFRAPLLRDLATRFPDGRCNAWGVPAGASAVIKHLQTGDVVLLVQTLRLGGLAPALCEVQVFYPRPLPELSQALWGEQHFPYVFFFRTERLDLSWFELRDLLGYQKLFDPRGKFYRVSEDKPASFESQHAFVQWLRRERGDLEHARQK